MYCSNCGVECPDQAQYCMSCGEKMVDTGKKEYEESNPPTQGDTFLNPRFPVAGIFLILHGLIFLYNAMFEKDWGYAYGGWRTVYVGSEGESFWLALLQFLIIIITVYLLFWKKKDKTLICFLVFYGLVNIAACICNIPTYSTYTHTADAAYAGLFENRIHHLVFIVEVISHCGMIFLAIISSVKNEKMTELADRTWFVPGALNCMEIILFIMSREDYMPRLMWSILCLIAENFFLGWWLAHPYKKQRISKCYADRQDLSAGDLPSHDRESENRGAASYSIPADASSFGFAVLGFFFPVVGLVLYLVWREQAPLRAKSAGKGALSGVITYIALTILLAILSVALQMAVLNSYF